MIYKILDLARWAPSGDNSQPWRFEIIDDYQANIHGYIVNVLSDYDLGVYNYNHFAFGCLLENIAIAATKEGYRANIDLLNESKSEHPLYRISLIREDIIEDPLANEISRRTTNRFRYSLKNINEEQKKVLTKALDPNLSCLWFESFSDKKNFAYLNYQFARLVHPELSGIIDWNAKYSKLHLPDESLGLSPINLRMARLVNRTPQSLDFSRKYLNGDFTSAFLGFYLPSLFSGCHVAVKYEKKLENYVDMIAIGRQFQRFWLTVTSLGLHLQMETGPLAYARKVWSNIQFTSNDSDWRYAQKMTSKLLELLGEENAKKTVMLARIGKGKPPPGRAIRLSVDELKYSPELTNDTIWHKVKPHG